MAINTVVTSGYGNGTFDGTIALVVTRGYTIGEAVAVVAAAAAPRIPISAPFFRVRFLVSESAHAEALTVGYADGHVLVPVTATGRMVSVVRAGGSVFASLAASDKLQVDSSAFGYAVPRAEVMIRRRLQEMEDLVILAWVRSNRGR